MKKKLALAVAAGAAVLSLSLSAIPAFAAINFNAATWTVGGVNYKLSNDGLGNSYGGVAYPSTSTDGDAALLYEANKWDAGSFSAGPY